MVGSFLNVVIVRIPQRLQWQWHDKAKDFRNLRELQGPRHTAPIVDSPSAGGISAADQLPGA